jgi:hypothetical protein
MNNFLNYILSVADGEPIQAIVIGYWGQYSEYKAHSVPKEIEGVVISLDMAKPYLNYEYDYGFGSPEGHAITAWTATKVIFVSTYDGATWVEYVPRNPVNHMPTMPGGG